MARFKQFKQHKKSDNNHRWLVSYADYMTLMFALFVVMYAMAAAKNEQLAVFSDTISNVFNHSANKTAQTPVVINGNPAHTINKHHNTATPKLTSAQDTSPLKPLSNMAADNLGQTLDSLQQELNKALSYQIKQGYAQIQKEKDWLTIELSSGLMFNSGSAIPTASARGVLQTLLPIINTNRNYIRIRGYTDDLPINNEIFRSNWHLSTARATEVLILLELLGVNSARMAAEGYGQYAPFADNSDPSSRQQNRKVVIAISKYGLPPEEIQVQNIQQAKTTLDTQQKTDVKRDNEIKVIKLENGGILITTREQ